MVYEALRNTPDGPGPSNMKDNIPSRYLSKNRLLTGDSGSNDRTIGSYNHYYLSPNGIPSGNQRWYGLVYLVYT